MGGSGLKNDIHYQMDDGKPDTASEIFAVGKGKETELSALGRTPDGLERTLFWHFPGGKGAVQPWRRRLWELQNNLDHE